MTSTSFKIAIHKKGVMQPLNEKLQSGNTTKFEIRNKMFISVS